MFTYETADRFTKETMRRLAKEYNCKPEDITVGDGEFLYIYYLDDKQIFAD